MPVNAGKLIWHEINHWNDRKEIIWCLKLSNMLAIVDVSIKEEKLSEFKSWFSDSNKTLSKFDGFVSRRLIESENGSRRILVEFENIELFKKMHQSDEHNKFHSQLGDFMNELPQRQFFEVISE